MMMRGKLLMVSAVAVFLAGCGEKSQTLNPSSAKKADAKAWEGVATGTEYTAGGYKAGDKTAWEAQLKARTERGQNEYTHIVSGKP
jgi:ABC-type glycerol-3-phosphate transport system substrate-binding protein